MNVDKLLASDRRANAVGGVAFNEARKMFYPFIVLVTNGTKEIIWSGPSFALERDAMAALDEYCRRYGETLGSEWERPDQPVQVQQFISTSH